MTRRWPPPLPMSAQWSVFDRCDRCGAAAGRTCVDLRDARRAAILNPHPRRRMRGPRARRAL